VKVMGGYIKRDVERVEVTPLNTKVNKEVFDAFKDRCKEQGYPLNVMLETFMRQYSNGNFHLSDEDIMKFKNDGKEESTLNTTFNKEVYTRFKSSCKGNGYFVKHVVAAFMEKYSNRNLVLEYVDMTKE
jgi:disulfide oxidoreductase YuzD